jgi:DNA-binding CsgD family transcriptional regulator
VTAAVTTGESKDWGYAVERLLERDAVVRRLQQLVEQAVRGAGQVALVSGEAGIGKTAVLARFVGGLASSTRVLQGWCDPLEVPRPLGPLIDALAGLDTAAAAALEAAVDAGDTAALYRQLMNVLRGGRRWVWVIEDAHWADTATLDLIRFVARRIATLPLLLVVSYRDDELAVQHPLTVALGDVAASAAVSRIRLSPLSRQAVATLAAGSGVNAEELHRLTAGNPFFVTEVLAAGPEVLSPDALPRSVSEVVRGRLGRLSAAARDVVDAVAVCGPRTSPTLVRSVCPAPGAVIDECLAAGVLVTDGDVVGFRHEIARRAALDQIPSHKRNELHARALASLDGASVDPNTLAELAFHAEQAGDHDAALRHGAAAAERAAALSANREAADLYALVLRHAADVADLQRVFWVEQYALACYLCGLGDAAVASWRAASELRHRLGDPLAESENLRWLAHESWALGKVADALDAARASERLVREGGATPQRAWAEVNLAELSTWCFDPAAAEHISQATALAHQLGDADLIARARGCAAVSLVLHTDSGWEELEAVWRTAMSTEVRGENAGLLGLMLCWLAAVHHHTARADRYIAEALAYCRDHNLLTFEANIIGMQAMTELHCGDWDHAAACAEDVLTRPGLIAVHRLVAQVTLALVRARRGEPSSAALLDDAMTSSEPAQLRLFSVWAARAETAWLAGDDETARAEAAAGLAASPRDADPCMTGLLRRWLYVAGGAPDQPDEHAQTPYALEIAGDWQAAAYAWMQLGCPYDAAIAQLGGDIAAVQAAAATFRRLGARAAARRAQQRLAALRCRPDPWAPRPDTVADPDRLTRREREVLGLLAAGRTDAEIANTLSISPKTVGRHVGSILAKLGVDNRVQAAARALQREHAAGQ